MASRARDVDGQIDVLGEIESAFRKPWRTPAIVIGGSTAGSRDL